MDGDYMGKIESVLQRFPQYAYDLNDNRSSILGVDILGSMRLGYSTALYRLIKSIIDEFNITMSNINRIDKMIDINTVLPDDMYTRFGALLNIRQNKGETDEQYRNRLKVSVTSLSGGTAEAIRYAIASGLGINDDPVAMERIRVYDAWKYNGTESVVREYGYVVCTIDLNAVSYSSDIENTMKIISESASNVKSAGIIVQFVYYNFRIIYYAELDNVTYASLDNLIYDKVGE